MKNTTKDDLKNSISSIYSSLLNKRKVEREKKAEEKRERKEQELEAKTTNEDDDNVIKLSKKERRAAELDNWKEVIIGLTGDDLEYTKEKKKKRKYRKWIDDEDENKVIDKKQKKVKKRNYRKEFEPELNMLRTLVTEQNKFTTDLQRRFQNAVGPANKDAMIPNKTLVDLASAIVSGRSNSLGVLKEIGTLKKTIAELYMKQKKLDSDLGGSSGNVDNSDLMLLGSNIMSGMSSPFAPVPEQPQVQQQPIQKYDNSIGYEPVVGATPQVPQSFSQPQQNIVEFDPSSWDGGPDMKDNQVSYENIKKTVLVEKNSSTGAMRFKAVRDDNGEEIVGYPGLPTVDPMKLSVNEKDNTVKGLFDEIYKLEVI